MLDGASYLDDILGVAIGFTTIMLLLSLVATALVQIIQNLLSLRFKNLSLGIFTVLKSIPQTKDITIEKIKNDILSRPFEKTNWFFEFFNKKKTWIEPDALAAAVEAVIDKPLIQEEKEKIKKSFLEMYGYLRKRFLALTRVWSVIIAIIIAFTFQVDSFDLLRKISSDPEMRMQLEKKALDLVEQNGQGSISILTYENISDSALVVLQASFPDLAPQIEQASGIGQDRKEIIQELDDIMSDEKPDMRDEVLVKYADLLDGLHHAEVKQGLDRIHQFSGELALFDIRPVSRGWSYYWSIQNIVGMLMTAIFLTFGAPFWFERLGELIKLKDAIRKKQTVVKIKNKEADEDL